MTLDAGMPFILGMKIPKSFLPGRTQTFRCIHVGHDHGSLRVADRASRVEGDDSDVGG